MRKRGMVLTGMVLTGMVLLWMDVPLWGGAPPAWEKANPIRPIPKSPLGIDEELSDLDDPPTPARVRLGRWLFYDKRLSADDTISCATCHRPEFAFSEPTPVSTGIRGQKGTRKAPSIVNLAWTLFPHFFWDGRAASLEEQALGPIANPIEMGNTHEKMLERLRSIESYPRYFHEAFGSPEISLQRVAKAIADYERTRLSGNSPVDRWRLAREENAVSPQVKMGYELFFGKAECNQCHFGQNFTDSRFHNLGIGWDPKTQKFADPGRFAVTKKPEDLGAFKTPGLREVAKHPPYMHDGSLQTLREVVEHYNKGGNPNPHLSPKIRKLGLTDAEISAIVAFLEALSGEGYEDTPPSAFP
ncbi:MAG: cytochrome-c peroxidase, partial [Deltaproteobacteria bacterium]